MHKTKFPNLCTQSFHVSLLATSAIQTVNCTAPGLAFMISYLQNSLKKNEREYFHFSKHSQHNLGAVEFKLASCYPRPVHTGNYCAELKQPLDTCLLYATSSFFFFLNPIYLHSHLFMSRKETYEPSICY